jgi:hypothetical protein
MKNKLKKIWSIIISLCIIFSLWGLTGCNTKETIQNDYRLTEFEESQTVSSERTDGNSEETDLGQVSSESYETQEVSAISDDGRDEENTVNKYFFPGMGTKAQYDYEGSIWGMAIDENAYLEEYVQEELFAKATLTVTEVAQLTKGKVYELNFFIHGEEVSPKFRETNIHLWVTNEAIYYLTPPDDFDYQKCMVDGKFDYLVYAKVLEETRQLPSDDKTRMLCYETNMEVQDGAYETTISVEGDTCTYSTVHDAGHFIKYEWKAGKGIDYYAYGYGGEREGMRLMRVE